MVNMDNNKMRTHTKRPRTGKQQPARLVPEACAAASALAADAEAAVADLEERRPLGIGPLERALAARVRSAAAQLLACAYQVESDGLMVSGSMGQDRAHPLLKVIADLRRELADALKELTFRVEQAEMIELMNELPRKERLANNEMADLVLESLQAGSEADAAANRPSRGGSVPLPTDPVARRDRFWGRLGSICRQNRRRDACRASASAGEVTEAGGSFRPAGSGCRGWRCGLAELDWLARRDLGDAPRRRWPPALSPASRLAKEARTEPVWPRRDDCRAKDRQARS
jgi:hypothetical protein